MSHHSADVPAAVEPPTAAANDTMTASLSNRRQLRGPWLVAVMVIGAFYAGFYLYTAQFGLISVETHRGFYVGLAAVLIALLYPARRGRDQTSVPLYDIVFATVCAASFGYFVVNYADLQARVGAPTTVDLVMGGLAILCCLEMTRRTTGWALTIVGLLAIAYAFFGQALPGLLQHGGYTFERFVNSQYMSLNGMFGGIAAVFANFVLLFIVFGTFLEKSGAARFYVDLPYALAARLRGGPAKVALLVSAMLGSVTGSPVANVMTTGNFTIPLMKRAGYSKSFAGGVEAAASTGGQILPPVMGAGAFLIAEFTGTSYQTVVLVSLIPAVLYFATVYFFIDFESMRKNLAGQRDGRPVGEVFRQGWFYLLPLILVFTLVLQGRSPAFAAFWGCVACIIVGLVPYRGERGGSLRKYWDALWQSSVRSLDVGGIVATIGIVIGVMGLTGFGLRVSALVVDISAGSLLLALILVTVASWVLGMGLTSTSSYIVVAILAAPALEEYGLSILVAHLIIFWVSQDANLTPPICLTAFAAASISGAKPYSTAWEAWKLGRGLYLVPLLMAYTPLIDGSLTEKLTAGLIGLVAVYFWAAGLSRYMRMPANWAQVTLLLVGGALLIAPGWMSTGLGALLGIAVWAWQTLQRRTAARTQPVGM